MSRLPVRPIVLASSALTVALLTGCPPFDLSAGDFPCTADTDCASGYRCNGAKLCESVDAVDAGGTPDAGETPDAGDAPDAGDSPDASTPACDDATQNGDETGVDCGGSCPNACPSCTDTTQNGDETGVDCGGSCPNACPTCNDSTQNGDETGVDCGGSCPNACTTCNNGSQDGDETGVDCGGSCPNACPSCNDSTKNGNESGVDCGGPIGVCARCDRGGTCNDVSDCVDGLYCNGGACLAEAPSCRAILEAGRNLDGSEYRLDPDGPGALRPMPATCDFRVDNGGWTLVLNYVHRGGTNPELNVRTGDLPLLRSDNLGDDESTTAEAWGHASNALLTAFQFREVRWFGRTNHHDRIIHFRSSAPAVTAYLRTGVGCLRPDIADRSQAAFLVDGERAVLPFAPVVLDGFCDRGDLAMTDFPFYGHPGEPSDPVLNAHWGIRGQESRWEVDDFPSAEGGCNECFSTIHRVWIR